MDSDLTFIETDIKEVIKRAVKVILEGLAVAVAAKYIPNQPMNIKEIIMIGFTAAMVFAILDMYAPSVGEAARQGVGFTIGSNTIGGFNK
jgi:hypothetical protein